MLFARQLELCFFPLCNWQRMKCGHAPNRSCGGPAFLIYKEKRVQQYEPSIAVFFRYLPEVVTHRREREAVGEIVRVMAEKLVDVAPEIAA